MNKKYVEFIPEPFWIIKAKLKKGIIVAEHKRGKIFDKEEAEKIIREIVKDKDALVTKITQGKSKKKSLPGSF